MMVIRESAFGKQPMRKAQENQDRGLGGPFAGNVQRGKFPPFRVTVNVIEHP
jgi:hypothetical protein